jgi:hypothetical protein
MSKTSFKLPADRAPGSSAADAWVGEGAKQPTTARQAESKGKVARLTIDLPAELHARFKSVCALQGTKMVAEVLRFIENYTQKHS